MDPALRRRIPSKKVEGFLRKVPKGCVGSACRIEFYMSKIQARLKNEDRSHMFRSKNKELISLMTQLLGLEDAVTSGRCRPEFWRTIKVLESKVDERRVENVKYLVDHFGTKYYQQCITTKISKHNDERSRMERRIHESLEPFLNRVIYARICYHFPERGEINHCEENGGKGVTKPLLRITTFLESDQPTFINELMLMIVGSPYERQLREALMARQINHPSIRNRLEQLLDENIVKTCRQFVEQMEPIYIDTEVNHLGLAHDDGDKGSRFFLGLAHYRLCKQAVENRDGMMRIVFREPIKMDTKMQ